MPLCTLHTVPSSQVWYSEGARKQSFADRHPLCFWSPRTRTSPVSNLLPTPLLHLRLPLALRGGARLRHTRGIRVPRAAPEAAVHAVQRVRTVGRHNDHAPPRPVAEQGSKGNASIRPVRDVPHVLGQARGVEVLARALDGAIGEQGGARLALEQEVDQELGAGEDEVQDQRAAREGGAEEEGAQDPEEAVDGEGEVEGCVEAARVVGGEGFGGFLAVLLVLREVRCSNQPWHLLGALEAGCMGAELSCAGRIVTT